MSTPHADVDDDADRLARVKLSSAIEPGDLRVTGLLSDLGAGNVLRDVRAPQRESPASSTRSAARRR